MAEAEHAVARDKGFGLICFRCEHADFYAVLQFARGDGADGLREQPAGIEREDIDGGAAFRNGVQNRLILDAKAGGEGDPPFDCASQKLDAPVETGGARKFQVKKTG